MERKALGKGLSALIPEKKSDDQATKVTYLKTSEVQKNRFQPRTDYNLEKLEELKASIKDKGVLQPILVREIDGKFEIIAGERRLRAVTDLAYDEIPAIIKDVTDQEALVIALIENIQREELNPIEEAEAYKRLIEDFQLTQESVAASVGKDRSTISNLMRLLSLPDDIKDSVYRGDLSAGHARALLSLQDTEDKHHFFEEIIKNSLSVRELENLIGQKTKAPRQRRSVPPEKNSQIVALEEGLQQLLGTKVRIETKKKRGKVVIDFYSPEELNRIVKLIIKK